MKKLIKILENPLINITALERRIGCPDGTIRQALAPSSPKGLPAKWVFPIVKELAAAGFMIDGWRFKFDEDTHCFIVSADLGKEPEVVDHGSWFEYKVSQSRDILDGWDLLNFLKEEGED